MKRSWFVALGLVACLASAAQATVPSTLSYQGVLTDNVGNIQPDGLYNFVFKIYTVGSGGSAIWTETDNNVQLTKGSFTVLLGNVATLSGLAFDVPYYLGISVNGQPELTPRVQLASSAYGLSLRLPFSGVDTSVGPLFTIRNTSGGFDIAADHSMLVGITSPGYFNLGAPGASLGLASLYSYGGLATAPTQTGVLGFGGAFDLYDYSGNVTSTIEPDVDGLGGGYFTVAGGGGGGHRFTVDGNSDGAGSPHVTISGNGSSMNFDTGATGDLSVNLPNNAIDAVEILDEPGVSQGKVTASFNVTSATPMVDVVTTTITIPAPGYIVLVAHAQAGLNGTTGTNYMIGQIDDTAGGGEDTGHSEYVGGGAFPSTATFYEPYSNTRTYFEGLAGTYTFRFEAEKGGGGNGYFYNPTLTAMYFPTGYGTVTTTVTQTAAARFASPQTVTAVSQDGRVSGDAARVDLRELELQVAREESRLAESRARLEQARHARQVQNANAQGQRPAAKPAGGGN